MAFRQGVQAFRHGVQDSLFGRTFAHVLVWSVFGVILAVTPFVYAWGTLHPGQDIAWGDILHPPELVLISIALAAGASGELFLRTALSRERTFTVGAWFSYPASLIVIGLGTILYANVSKPGGSGIGGRQPLVLGSCCGGASLWLQSRSP